jgi:beta-phosphoglucomutase
VIRAMIFDLDGTLVQTEWLKALSYARAVIELCPYKISEGEVIEAFKEVVGRPRQEVATALMERFGLEEAARTRTSEFGVSAPWQAFVQVRLSFFEQMMADREVLRANQWPHNVALLEEARRTGCKTALVTMSNCARTRHILDALDLADAFDFVASLDDVEHGKPNPEIYQLVSRELDIPPAECLVIEDSPSGIKAVLAAGMWLIVLATPMTRKGIHALQPLDDRWIVDDPTELMAVVRQMIAERKED